MRILLVEDDAVLAEILTRSLTEQNYVVDTVADGQLGWEYAQDTPYDLILTDVELPKLNGITLCQRLRTQGCTVPILLITAKDASNDRIRGLDAGADDYLIKPLDLGEFQARVRALLRRGEVVYAPVLQLGALQLDPSRRQVTYLEKLLTLTPKEYSLLELFLRHPSRVLSRGDIIEHLWTFDDPPQEESVKSHIKGLRQKLKAAGAVDWIENVYGLGYRLREDVVGKQNDRAAAQKSGATVIHSPQAPNPSTEQQYNQAIDHLWQKYQDLMVQRFEVLQQVSTALQTGTLSLELRHAGEQAAHKLAGVLGMFDREAGTQIARSIEQYLSSEGTLPPSQEMLHLIQQLSEVLDVAPSSSSKSDVATLQTVGSPSHPLPATLTQPKAVPQKIHISKAGRNQTLPVQAWKVLAIDDDPVILSALEQLLQPWGIQITGLSNPLQFWEILPTVTPDLLILDVEMPQLSGIQLCEAVRADADWQSLPIVFLTAHQDSATVQQVFAAGADDYVVKPVVGQELLTRITNRLERLRLLQTLSTKDPLTGLANQPQSSHAIEHLLQQANDQHPVCFAVLSLMELRQINVRYGHLTGNQVLQQWGRLLQTHFGTGEILGYWGNGEFVVGVSATPIAIQERLDHLLASLRQQVFTAIDGSRFQATCRVAIAQAPLNGQTLQSLYQTASSTLDQRSS